jgi:hypothetical protein
MEVTVLSELSALLVAAADPANPDEHSLPSFEYDVDYDAPHPDEEERLRGGGGGGAAGELGEVGAGGAAAGRAGESARRAGEAAAGRPNGIDPNLSVGALSAVLNEARGRGLHSFTLELNLSHSRTHS